MDSAKKENGEWLAMSALRRLMLGPFLVLVLSLRSLAILAWLVTAVPYQWDLTYPEAAVVARAADVARGESPYHDWREWPHAFAPYGPLTYFTTGTFAILMTSFREGKYWPVYLAGRTVSLAFIVGIAMLAAAILFSVWPAEVKRWRWPWAFAAAAATLAWEDLTYFALSVRPDAAQVFFSLLALTIALRGEPTPKRTAAALAALSISFWFKAFSFGMLAALVYWMARGGGMRRAALGLGGFVAANAALALAINTATDGLLLLNLVGSLDNGWEPYNWIQFTRWVPAQGWFVLLGGMGFAVFNLLNRRTEPAVRLVSLAALLSFGASAAAYLKVGADINYVYEAVILFGVNFVRGIAGFWYLPLSGRDSIWREIGLAAVISFTAILAGQAVNVRSDIAQNKKFWRPLPISAQLAREERVLSSLPFLALQGQSRPAILDYLQYRVLTERGRIDTAPLMERVRAREFSAIVIDEHPAAVEEGYFTPEFYPTLRAFYEKMQSFGTLSVYRPKDQ